ncbi:MAG: alpha/beta fold hydrolase, partial [Ktedonobacteraceae bacterium]|nr:alpha/beta fold hydrolase [Ktedonobacteraceae bacterium]
MTLSPIDPTVYRVATWLCAQGSLNGKTVQVLVHGSTYDHNYWDFPSVPQKYSYVRQITGAGYATLNMDRIGTGLSDHPPALSVTLQSNAYVLHQLVQALRNGKVYGIRFPKVMLVGHSFGSVITVAEASQFADVDGVITTGIMHTVNATGAATVFSSFYPVELDSKFAQSKLPLGYLTSIPGVRKSIFYNPDNADPSVISLDETLKQTITDSELATVLTGLSPTSSLQVRV